MTKDPINILLVDDHPAKLLSYEAILQGLGENLIKAGSAREAFEHLLKKDIAIVLSDVCMPELDGFELARMIRNHPRFQHTAIIFISAVALTDPDRVKGYSYGAVDYVLVPIVPELLLAKVRVFADLFRKTRQLEFLNAELERRVEERTAELERRVEERTRERETAWAQVQKMQKLESMGQLTGASRMISIICYWSFRETSKFFRGACPMTSMLSLGLPSTPSIGAEPSPRGCLPSRSARNSSGRPWMSPTSSLA